MAQWLGKLWIYPYWSAYFYAFIFIPGFSAYLLMIAESYLATKALFDYLRRGRKTITSYKSFEYKLYKPLGLTGILLIVFSLIMIIANYAKNGGYIFNINQATNIKVGFVYILTIFVGIWFMLESVEFIRKKTSLLKDIFHSYFTPALAILTSSLVLAIIMETQNIPKGFWVYTNWPLDHIKFLGLPITMLMAWPLHYIAILSFFRAFTGSESDEIWKGDLLK